MWYEGTYSCGHKGQVQLYGKKKENGERKKSLKESVKIVKKNSHLQYFQAGKSTVLTVDDSRLIHNDNKLLIQETVNNSV